MPTVVVSEKTLIRLKKEAGEWMANDGKDHTMDEVINLALDKLEKVGV